jgi:hypothetical protein
VEREEEEKREVGKEERRKGGKEERRKGKGREEGERAVTPVGCRPSFWGTLSFPFTRDFQFQSFPRSSHLFTQYWYF